MNEYKVVDLFSGGGGMSYGFHANPLFKIIGAADAEIGKPSSGESKLGCNLTYFENVGVMPVRADLGNIDVRELASIMDVEKVDVLLACPPCTGFSRANFMNHLVDDPRNGLVARVADFAEMWLPEVIVMENARELITGNFRGHYIALKSKLEKLGYQVDGRVHMLTEFGLPQRRERSIVIASRLGVKLRSLEDLWKGYRVRPEALTVRSAIASFEPLEAGQASAFDSAHVAPAFGTRETLQRIRGIPHDGGSWRDLIDRNPELLTPSMLRSVERGRLGSHPDVYGRMRWDEPAITIKRECGHVGNGRYAHPEQDRLCSLREIAVINGFPREYRFGEVSLANKYRHVGDAVPPLISYQLSRLVQWMLTGERPDIEECLLPGGTLSKNDIVNVDYAECV